MPMNPSPSQPRDQEPNPYIRPQVESSPQSPFVLRYNPDRKRTGPKDYTRAYLKPGCGNQLKLVFQKGYPTRSASKRLRLEQR